MSFQLVNPLEIPDWDDLMIRFPNASFFHSAEWARVLSESYGYRPRYVASLEENRINAVLPVMEMSSSLTGKRGVSLPFTDFCEPLVRGRELFHKLNQSLIAYGRDAGWKSMEWRCGDGFFGDEVASAKFYTHEISLLQGENEFASRLRSSTRRNIRKAEKEGVEVQIGDSSRTVEAFYRMNCQTRRRHGLPPQPRLFFHKVFEHIVSQARGLVVLAAYMGRFIAGAVFFHFGKRALYKFGASDMRFQALRANNLVMWQAIRWYLNRGFDSLCLGRTEPENKGLLQFKRGWNAEERVMTYHKYDFSRGRFVKGSTRVTGMHNKVFRMMPMPLLKWVGSALYKHVG